MPREKKDHVPVSIKMSATVYEKLEEFCKLSGQSKTTAIERALEYYICHYNEIITSKPASVKE